MTVHEGWDQETDSFSSRGTCDDCLFQDGKNPFFQSSSLDRWVGGPHTACPPDRVCDETIVWALRRPRTAHSAHVVGIVTATVIVVVVFIIIIITPAHSLRVVATQMRSSTPLPHIVTPPRTVEAGRT